MVLFSLKLEDNVRKFDKSKVLIICNYLQKKKGNDVKAEIKTICRHGISNTNLFQNPNCNCMKSNKTRSFTYFPSGISSPELRCCPYLHYCC